MCVITGKLQSSTIPDYALVGNIDGEVRARTLVNLFFKFPLKAKKMMKRIRITLRQCKTEDTVKAAHMQA
jgi:hypothetical protein